MKPDERIIQGRNKNAVIGFYILIVSVFINIIVKLILKKDIGLFVVDGIALVISLIYYLVASIRGKTLFVSKSDEYIELEKNRIKYNIFGIIAWSYLLGMIVTLLYYLDSEILFCLMYILVLIVPVGYIVVMNYKNGIVFTIPTKDRKKFLRNQKISAVATSIFITTSNLYFNDAPLFPPTTGVIITFIVFATIGSFAMYYTYKYIFMKAGKIADKAANKQIGSDE